MKKLGWLPVLLLMAGVSKAATTFYVTTDGRGDGSSWASPTNSIQGAIDASDDDPASVVWVSNGVYGVGGTTGWPAGGSLSNRVVIWKAITVRSVNGPSDTSIKGAWNPVTTNGPAAVRCVYMVNGATLVGFTLTNGATRELAHTGLSIDRDAGGVLCQTVAAVTLSNCWIVGNAGALYGGGAQYGTLYDCIIDGNLGVGGGGGVHESRLFNCTVSRNRTVTGYGAGMSGSGGASNCVFVANHAGYLFGGAAFASRGTLVNCTIVSNTATAYGGGIAYGTAYNCLFFGNAAPYGGGAYDMSLYNCTVAGNTATSQGGGIQINETKSVIGCIVYGNSCATDANWGFFADAPVFSNSCTTPAQAGWHSSNTTNDPKFVSVETGNYRLRKGSPCIDTGLNEAWATSGALDLDLLVRIVPEGGRVDMGAYEYVPPIPLGTLLMTQ